MKYFATLIFVAITLQSLSQNIKITEPEFSETFIYVNDSIGSGIKLEQQTCSARSKANGVSYVPVVGMFAGKSTSKGVVQGAKSTVQIDKSRKTYFIVKVKDNSIDPTTVINIFKLYPSKEERHVIVATAKTMGGTKAGEIEFLKFTGKKYGTSSYLIELDNLESGEYAMTLPIHREIFNMFGVK